MSKIATSAAMMAQRRRLGVPRPSQSAMGHASGQAMSPRRASDVTVPLDSGTISMRNE